MTRRTPIHARLRNRLLLNAMKTKAEIANPGVRAVTRSGDAAASVRHARRVLLYAVLLSALSSIIALFMFSQPAMFALAVAGSIGGVFLLGAVAAHRACDEATQCAAALDHLPLAYALLDDKRRVIALSDRARRMLGLAEADWHGRNWETLLGGATPDSPSGEMPETGVRWGAIRPDGLATGIRYQLAPMRAGRREMHVLLIHDAGEIMTAYREESESARIRTAACLATQIAHEVRNPVAAISGSAQLLGILNEKARQGDERSRDLLISEQDALCRSIVNESQRLDGIISRFLSFSDLSEDSLRTVMELPENKEDLAQTDSRAS